MLQGDLTGQCVLLLLAIFCMQCTFVWDVTLPAMLSFCSVSWKVFSYFNTGTFGLRCETMDTGARGVSVYTSAKTPRWHSLHLVLMYFLSAWLSW